LDAPDLEADRSRYTDTAVGYWNAVQAGDGERATAYTREGERLVDRWVEAGKVESLLVPLLSDPNDKVRYAAAADLLRLDRDVDRSVAVLEALIASPVGLVSPTARLLLMTRNRDHS